MDQNEGDCLINHPALLEGYEIGRNAKSSLPLLCGKDAFRRVIAWTAHGFGDNLLFKLVGRIRVKQFR